MLSLIKYTSWLFVLALGALGEPLAGVTLGIGLVVGAIWGAGTEQKNQSERDNQIGEFVERMTKGKP